MTLAQMRALYSDRMSDDFPPDELRAFSSLEQAIRRGEYACYGAMEGETVLAYACLFFRREAGQCRALVDYFATRRDLRGQGVGRRFLKALIDGPVRAMDCVLVEVEDPDTASADASRETMRRRLSFYLRNGFADTGAASQVYGVDYRILALSAKGTPTRAEAQSAYMALYRALLPDRLYRRYVKIR